MQQQQQSQFSQFDIDRMRSILEEHDKRNPRMVREFDLNNPPKEPYRHQEFPKIVYHHGKRKHVAVHDAAQQAKALEAGYKIEPYLNEVAPAVELESEDEEIARLDKIAKQPKKSKSE